MTHNKTLALLLLVMGLSVGLLTAFLIKQSNRSSLTTGGSIVDDCKPTTTLAASGPLTRTLVTGPGTLCDVIIEGTAASYMSFYDATTSSVLKRATSMSTSSILIASFPISPTAGAYQFNASVVNGLLMSLSGEFATATVMSRYQ